MIEKEYIPYTYLVVFKPTGQWYYGVKYGKSANPNELWKTYFTSSKKIKNLIEKYGIEEFDFEIRKTFKNKIDAMNWEKKVLTKMKVLQNPGCLNMAISGNVPYYDKAMKKTNQEKYNSDYPLQNKEIRQKAHNTRKKNGYAKTQEKVKNTMQHRYGRHFFSTDDFKDKIKLTFQRKYGVSRVCDIPFVKEKQKTLNLGKIWVKHSELGQKRILPEELEQYISLGYTRGINNKPNYISS